MSRTAVQKSLISAHNRPQEFPIFFPPARHSTAPGSHSLDNSSSRSYDGEDAASSAVTGSANGYSVTVNVDESPNQQDLDNTTLDPNISLTDRLIRQHRHQFRDMVVCRGSNTTMPPDVLLHHRASFRAGFAEVKSYLATWPSLNTEVMPYNRSADGRDLRDGRFYDPLKTFVTVTDSETVLHRYYFTQLSFTALNKQSRRKRRSTMYRCPVFSVRNVERLPKALRVATHWNTASELSSLASFQKDFCVTGDMGTFTIPFPLVTQAAGWGLGSLAPGAQVFLHCKADPGWERLTEQAGMECCSGEDVEDELSGSCVEASRDVPKACFPERRRDFTVTPILAPAVKSVTLMEGGDGFWARIMRTWSQKVELLSAALMHHQGLKNAAALKRELLEEEGVGGSMKRGTVGSFLLL